MFSLAALSVETVNAVDLPMAPILYGAVALSLFAVFGIVTWSFRDVANRHKAKGDAYAAAHGGSHGTAGH